MLTGIALFAAAAAQQIGLLTTTVTNSGFLTGLYVVFTPILTVLALRRRPHWVVWPAALMASFGIFLLSGGELAALQDSMLPIEVGDSELRAGLQEVRELLGQLRHQARELVRTLGR